MDNIYKLVDNACTKVKNELACRRAADLIIIRELNHLDITDLPCANFNWLPPCYHHRAAYFYLLGQRRSIEMRVYQEYEREVSENYIDFDTPLSAQINTREIITALKRFINKNYLRISDISPSEILEAIPPIIYRVILNGDYRRGSSPPTYYDCRVAVVKWELV